MLDEHAGLSGRGSAFEVRVRRQHLVLIGLAIEMTLLRGLGRLELLQYDVDRQVLLGLAQDLSPMCETD